MVLALATTSLVLGTVSGPKRSKRKETTMATRSVRPDIKSRSKSGTKRFPKGRLVTDSGATGDAKLKVVIGSVIFKGQKRRSIAVNPGRKGATEIVAASDLSPVTLRRSVVGLKGKGTIKPRVKGTITTAKIRALKTTTQRQLDRAGG